MQQEKLKNIKRRKTVFEIRQSFFAVWVNAVISGRKNLVLKEKSTETSKNLQNNGVESLSKKCYTSKVLLLGN